MKSLSAMYDIVLLHEPMYSCMLLKGDIQAANPIGGKITRAAIQRESKLQFPKSLNISQHMQCYCLRYPVFSVLIEVNAQALFF